MENNDEREDNIILEVKNRKFDKSNKIEKIILYDGKKFTEVSNKIKIILKL